MTQKSMADSRICLETRFFHVALVEVEWFEIWNVRVGSPPVPVRTQSPFIQWSGECIGKEVTNKPHSGQEKKGVQSKCMECSFVDFGRDFFFLFIRNGKYLNSVVEFKICVSAHSESEGYYFNALHLASCFRFPFWVYIGGPWNSYHAISSWTMW